MGITAVVEDEQGEKLASVEDPTNILHRVLPEMEDPTFRHLNRIDWYGDTVFNRHQVPEVRVEIQRLSQRQNVADAEFLYRLDALAAQAEVEPHLYLRFRGD